MSDSLHGAHMAHRAIEGISETHDPIKGAGYGAIAAAGGVPATLALVGLALTPLGWAVALAGGAAAGAAYVARRR